MKRADILDIGEVVKLSGIPASSLRYYEEKGLIKSIGRNGLRRQYRSNVLTHLSLISMGQDAGFSLMDIAEIFTTDGPKIDRDKLLEKAEEIDRNIRRLTIIRDCLRHTAACKAPDHFECPTFIRMLKGTGKARKGRRKKPRITSTLENCRTNSSPKSTHDTMSPQ